MDILLFSMLYKSNKGSKHYAYIVKKKYENKNNIEFRKSILLDFDGIEFLGEIDLN